MGAGRLIIVDDGPVILRLLTSMFDGEGYEVVACPDGRSACEAIDQGVDVLLTDKNLPDVGGLELIARARAAWPDCEALLITGYASVDTAVQALQLGVFDYIIKPPKDIFQVKRKVQQAFEKVRLGRENRALLARLQERNLELEAALTELRDVQAELIQSEKLAGIGTLAAGIAHEIASPLFGVMGLAEAIQDEADRELVNGYASEIVEYSRAIKEIVVQLSGYSRSAEREYFAPVALDRVVGDAVKLVSRSVGTEPQQILVEVPAALAVSARPGELQQVFVNLVKNACEALVDRHGEHGGTIAVRAGADARGVWVDVQDDGPGIPAEAAGAIFDPFYTTKPPGRGTGLGLNIVYRIITRYRGTIAVDSAVGEGTTFHLRFPAVPADDA